MLVRLRSQLVVRWASVRALKLRAIIVYPHACMFKPLTRCVLLTRNNACKLRVRQTGPRRISPFDLTCTLGGEDRVPQASNAFRVPLVGRQTRWTAPQLVLHGPRGSLAADYLETNKANHAELHRIGLGRLLPWASGEFCSQCGFSNNASLALIGLFSQMARGVQPGFS